MGGFARAASGTPATPATPTESKAPALSPVERNAFRELARQLTARLKGAANEAVGKAKQGVGEATGSNRLQGEGAIQEIKGKGQQALGDAKEAAKDAINKAAAAANKKL